MIQLEKPDADPQNAGDYPADLVPPRCDFQCNAARTYAARVCIYWMTFTPQGRRFDFDKRKQVRTTFGYAKARWVYMDEWGCYMPPPTWLPGSDRGIADYPWHYDTDHPYDLVAAWKEAKSGLQRSGAPPAGTVQPFGNWLMTLNPWSSSGPPE